MHDGLAQALVLLSLKAAGRTLSRPSDAPAVAETLGEKMARCPERIRMQAPVDLRPPHVVSRGLGTFPRSRSTSARFSAHSGIAVELESGARPLGHVPSRNGGPGRPNHPGGTRQRAKHARPRVPGSGSSGTAPGSGYRSKTTAWMGPRDSDGFAPLGLQTMRERAEGLGGGRDRIGVRPRHACRGDSPGRST